MNSSLSATELNRRRKALFRAQIQEQLETAKQIVLKEKLKRKAISAARNKVSTHGMIVAEVARRTSINACITQATGLPKKQQTKDEAMTAAINMRKRHGGSFYHYECVHCGHWHVGKRRLTT